MPLTLVDIFEARKRLAAPVRWSKNGADLTFLASLDLQGVTQEGLFLRGSGKVYRPDEAIVLQLELHRPGRRSGGQLERICWRPIAGHTNPNRGPPELSGIEISGSHYHDFYLNFDKLADEMKKGNLRIARPIEPECPSFTDLIDFCARRFRVDDMEGLPVPPWEIDLFGDVA